MSASSIPDHDAIRRAAALAEYALMDTPAEPAFDALVHEAAQACQAPIAIMSLLDNRRQWFKARVGVDLTETPIEHAVCTLTISGEEPLVISDLTKDPRTSANPFVTGEPHVRFYAGAPIRLADGLRVGSLCVADTVPRPQGLSPWQEDRIMHLAGRAEALIDERRGQPVPTSTVPPPAPARGTTARIEKEGLLDLRDYAQAHGLSAAEALFQLMIAGLTSRK